MNPSKGRKRSERRSDRTGEDIDMLRERERRGGASDRAHSDAYKNDIDGA
ncbi:MAG: hypothetical protein LKG11_00055 [Bacilli bacterium]|jgi:hypothetical protein|nr:hypothetical protein [Bacilli bacterium]